MYLACGDAVRVTGVAHVAGGIDERAEFQAVVCNQGDFHGAGTPAIALVAHAADAQVDVALGRLPRV